VSRIPYSPVTGPPIIRREDVGCGLWTAWACVTGGCTGRNDCDGCNGSGDNIDSGSGEGFEVKWYDVCNG
jgi:hypothetical protein